jgi:hypothetical protein
VQRAVGDEARGVAIDGDAVGQASLQRRVVEVGEDLARGVDGLDSREGVDLGQRARIRRGEFIRIAAAAVQAGQRARRVLT